MGRKKKKNKAKSKPSSSVPAVKASSNEEVAADVVDPVNASLTDSKTMTVSSSDATSVEPTSTSSSSHLVSAEEPSEVDKPSTEPSPDTAAVGGVAQDNSKNTPVLEAKQPVTQPTFSNNNAAEPESKMLQTSSSTATDEGQELAAAEGSSVSKPPSVPQSALPQASETVLDSSASTKPESQDPVAPQAQAQTAVETDQKEDTKTPEYLAKVLKRLEAFEGSVQQLQQRLAVKTFFFFQSELTFF